MKRAALRLPMLVATLLAVAGCHEPPAKETKPAVPLSRRFVYVPPPPRVATHLPENFAQWTRVLNVQQQEMQQLQAKLATHQEIHLTNQFDAFLQSDLAGLPAEQLASLWHFADKGYFTVERRIIKRLLQDRLAENNPKLEPAKGQNIADRAALLAQQNELKLRDLRTASEMYASIDKGAFHIPQPADAEQLEALRSLAKAKLESTGQEMAKLDQEIEQLRAKLNE
jgi:hypothetical protein